MSPESETNSSDTLNRIIDELSELLLKGLELEADELINAHPEYQDQLRKIAPVLKQLATLEDTSDSLDRVPTLTIDQAESCLLGDFRLHQEIGRGGMGVVFEATQISLNRRVAIKVLPFGTILGEAKLQRFQNEARAAASLHHANIVPVYAVGCERSVHFYAMQLIPGRSMAGLISQSRQSNTQISWKSVCEWGIQIADALDYAHSVGVIHRDIKPANLIIQPDGKVWITDFGLAQFDCDSSITATGDIVGTLQYISPEQALGIRGNITHRTDIYSLGVTLFELLTLSPMFSSKERISLLRQVMEGRTPLLHELRKDTPKELETVLLKATSKDAQDRYATAKEFADDLRNILCRRPINAKPPPLNRRLMDWARRHYILFWGLVTTVLLTIVFGGGSAYFLQRQKGLAALTQAKEHERRLRLLEYANHIVAASHALDSGNVDDAKIHLSRCVPQSGTEDLRGYEWFYLDSSVAQPLVQIGKNHGDAYCVQVSPDGKLLVSSGRDGIRIWDRKNNLELKHLTCHLSDVNCVSYDASGDLLATAGDDGQVFVVSTKDWSIKQTLKLAGAVVSSRFLPDGKRLVVAERHVDHPTNHSIKVGNNRVRIFDWETGESLATIIEHQDCIQSLAISADGKWIASSGSDGDAVVWDIEAGKELWRFSHRGVLASDVPGYSIDCVAFANFHPWLATVGSNGIISLWSLETGQLVRERWRAPFRLQTACFSFEDSELITGGDGPMIQAWDLLQPSKIAKKSFVATEDRLWCLAVQGNSLAWADGNGMVREIRLWHDDGRLQLVTNASSFPTITPIETGFLVAYENQFEQRALLDSTASSAWSSQLPKQPRALAVDLSGKFLAGIVDNDCFIEQSPWDGLNRKWFDPGFSPTSVTFLDRLGLVEFRGPELQNVARFSFRTSNIDGVLHDSSLICPYRDFKMEVKGTQLTGYQGNEPIWEINLPNSHLLSCQFCQNSSVVAARFDDAVVRMFDESSGQIVHAFPIPIDSILAVSPDGKTLAAIRQDSILKSIQFWQIASGQPILTIPIGAASVQEMSFSRDGKTLMLSGH